jgi:hypothetical protein
MAAAEYWRGGQAMSAEVEIPREAWEAADEICARHGISEASVHVVAEAVQAAAPHIWRAAQVAKLRKLAERLGPAADSDPDAQQREAQLKVALIRAVKADHVRPQRQQPVPASTDEAGLPPCGCKGGECYHRSHPDQKPQRECRRPGSERPVPRGGQHGTLT